MNKLICVQEEFIVEHFKGEENIFILNWQLKSIEM